MYANVECYSKIIFTTRNDMSERNELETFSITFKDVAFFPK